MTFKKNMFILCKPERELQCPLLNSNSGKTVGEKINPINTIKLDHVHSVPKIHVFLSLSPLFHTKGKTNNPTDLITKVLLGSVLFWNLNIFWKTCLQPLNFSKSLLQTTSRRTLSLENNLVNVSTLKMTSRKTSKEKVWEKLKPVYLNSRKYLLLS